MRAARLMEKMGEVVGECVQKNHRHNDGFFDMILSPRNGDPEQ